LTDLKIAYADSLGKQIATKSLAVAKKDALQQIQFLF